MDSSASCFGSRLWRDSSSELIAPGVSGSVCIQLGVSGSVCIQLKVKAGWDQRQCDGQGEERMVGGRNSVPPLLPTLKRGS